MFPLRLGTQASRRDHTACTGCDLCQLVCPVWRWRRDPELTPHGRCMALMTGIAPSLMMPAAEACTLCGACEPACPENIDLVSQVIALRGGLPPPYPARLPRKVRGSFAKATSAALIADEILLSDPALLKKTLRLSGNFQVTPAVDHGIDIAAALERGKEVTSSRLSRFFESLPGGVAIVVADGLLYRKMLEWLPERHVYPLGEALLSNPAVMQRLLPSDFYVIEPRAYHADHARLVTFYDRLRREKGCGINLDLQRFAIPVDDGNTDGGTEQATWALRGMKPGRYVVENAGDLLKLRKTQGISAIHLAELTDD